MEPELSGAVGSNPGGVSELFAYILRPPVTVHDVCCWAWAAAERGRAASSCVLPEAQGDLLSPRCLFADGLVCTQLSTNPVLQIPGIWDFCLTSVA